MSHRDKMNKRYMLDTNIVSYLLKGDARVSEKIISVSMSALTISAITEGELLFGLAKRPDAKLLKKIVHEFLIRVDVLPWDSNAAEFYGSLRANLQKKGRILGNLDMLIAAHALSSDMVLITNDQAFRQVEGLKIEDWML